MLSLSVLIATLVVSSVSILGILFLSFREEVLHNILHILIAFSAGTILGTAFLDLVPEALELNHESGGYIYITLGFILFFFLERFIYWYHGHEHIVRVERNSEERSVPKTFVYLNLIGDAIHNFIDGMIIAASFMLGTPIGLATTLAVVFHELPQEVGDYGLLIYGGLERRKALFFNFVVALTTIFGGTFAILFMKAVSSFKGLLIAIAAGGFIYLSASELIPELKEEKELSRSGIQFAVFLVGLLLIWYLGKTFPS